MSRGSEWIWKYTLFDPEPCLLNTFHSSDDVIPSLNRSHYRYQYGVSQNNILNGNGPVKGNYRELVVIHPSILHLFYDIHKRDVPFENSIKFFCSTTLKRTYQNKIIYTRDEERTRYEVIFYEWIDRISFCINQ